MIRLMRKAVNTFGAARRALGGGFGGGLGLFGLTGSGDVERGGDGGEAGVEKKLG